MKKKKTKLLETFFIIFVVQIFLIVYTIAYPDSSHLRGLSKEYVKGILIGGSVFLWVGYLITLDRLTESKKKKDNNKV